MLIGIMLLLMTYSAAESFEAIPVRPVAPDTQHTDGWAARYLQDYPECSPRWSADAGAALLVLDDAGRPVKVRPREMSRLIHSRSGAPRVIGYCTDEPR